MSSKPALTTPPPPLKHALISFPTPQILLVTLNRPDVMNCINPEGHWELERVWRWYDSERSLRCAILTGAKPPMPLPGKKGMKSAFCAGQDLKVWNDTHQTSNQLDMGGHPPGGFGGLSRREGKKPIICAVDGITFGGGFEMILNADLILATPTSTFSFPEAFVGVSAFAGALPRLLYTVGLPRATELAITGRILSASEAQSWGLINQVVSPPTSVIDAAVKMARKVAEEASPDSVIVSRRGIRLGWSGLGVEAATKMGEMAGPGKEDLEAAENIKEGLKSFVGKRKPKWVDSKL